MTAAGELQRLGPCVSRMVSVQNCTRSNMAGLVPASPGFGRSGKSFLIDSLLKSQCPSAQSETYRHLRAAVCEDPRRTWGQEHEGHQNLTQSPRQGKFLAGPLLQHSGNYISYCYDKRRHYKQSPMSFSYTNQKYDIELYYSIINCRYINT